MIAPWLVYTILLSALFGIAGLGLEYVARAGNWSARWVWLLAIVATVLVPVAINEFASPRPHEPLALSTSAIFEPELPVGRRDPVSLDTPLLALWFLASVVIAGRIVATFVLLRRSRARWDEVELDGEAVLLSSELGPAVIGLTRRRTVMPRWALEFDTASRALMLRHEAEHARAGDPWLLAAAACSLVVMPWNPVLLWLVRRLRLAIEMDCDARVLASDVNPRAYASLLVAVGERMSHTPFAWAIALATPRSFLERRIVAMTSPFRPRFPRLTIAAIGAGVVLTLAIACGTEHPDPVMASTPSAKTLAMVAPADPTDTMIAKREHGAYAKAGDTVVVDLTSVEGDHFNGTIRTRGNAGSKQYLYGRRPIVIRYPDGSEVVADRTHSISDILNDHSHDKPETHTTRINERSTSSPMRVGERVCVVKGAGDANRPSGMSTLIVGNEYCVYRGRGD